MKTWCVSFFSVLLAMPMLASAGAVITYHGRIVDSASRPVESANVTFKIRVLSPNPGKCLLYEESRSINMQNSDGVFVIPIGDGGGTRTPFDPGLLMEKIFANDPGKSFLTADNPKIICNSASGYTPQVLDQRQLVVSFDDHSGVGEQILPAMDINFVPLAVSSYDAQNIGGTPASSVLRVSSGPVNPLTPANFSELVSLLNGTSIQYEKPGKLNGVNLPVLSNGQVLGWNGSWTAITPMTSFTETDPLVKPFAKADLPVCGANEFLKPSAGGFVCTAVSGANGGTVTSVTAGGGLLNTTNPGLPITSSGTLAVDVGTGVGKILQFSEAGKLPILDGSNLSNVKATSLDAAASINITGNINTTGSVTAGTGLIAGGNSNIQTTNGAITTKNFFLYDSVTPTPNSIGFKAPNNITLGGGASYTLTLPDRKGLTGQVLAAKDGLGTLEWISPSTGSVTSVGATLPVKSSGGTTPVISMDQANATTDGYLSKLDWDAFNKKQSSTLATGNIWVGNLNAATAVLPSQDVSVAVDGKFTVKQVQGNAFAVTTLTNLDANKIYKWDGTQFVASYLGLADLRKLNGTTQVVACPAGQIATWESVTNDTFCVTISVGGSNFAAQTMNTVFAGPASGANATPTFRALVVNDIPALTLTKITDAGTAAYKNVPAAGNAGITEVVFGTDTRLTDTRTPTDNSVTTIKIADGNVTDLKIASVSAAKITGTVGTANLPVADGNTVGKESGILSGVAQAIKGVKTFLDNLVTNGNLSVGGTLSTTGAATFASTLAASGRVDANAGIKVGSSVTCTVAEEGTQRYNATTKNMEFCNGSQWIGIGQVGGVNSLRSCNTGNPNDVMVPVGSWCVDKYEASVWSVADGTGTGFFTDSTTSGDTDPYYPTGVANVPTGCNRNGAGCIQFAVSKPNVIPSRGMTWYQAAKFCANAGKVMIPDDVWQVAAIGTVDPGAGAGGTGGTAGGSGTDALAAQCNINTHNATWTTWLKPSNGVRMTAKAGATPGGTNACMSDYGVEDMVGNLWEWTSMNGVEAGVASGFTQGANNASGGPFATADGTWNINGSAYGCDGDGATKGTCAWKNNTPAAALRGGAWNNGAQSGVAALHLSHSGSLSSWSLGFRCARPR